MSGRSGARGGLEFALQRACLRATRVRARGSGGPSEASGRVATGRRQHAVGAGHRVGYLVRGLGHACRRGGRRRQRCARGRTPLPEGAADHPRARPGAVRAGAPGRPGSAQGFGVPGLRPTRGRRDQARPDRRRRPPGAARTGPRRRPGRRLVGPGRHPADRAGACRAGGRHRQRRGAAHPDRQGPDPGDAGNAPQPASGQRRDSGRHAPAARTRHGLPLLDAATPGAAARRRAAPGADGTVLPGAPAPPDPQRARTYHPPGSARP